ncbi:Trafficking protein particle complex subunit [Citrus sinensis]|uniref:Trafficking protein particle complex subunit n=1 Tax=Citrus sinensis TaxID=2711 RepID=A0ACB8HRX7_CITSI|nr:Trafficking protein particle complex subunit [Citrus sinensis]
MQFFGGSEISPSPPVPTASGNNAHMMYVFNRNGVCLLYREWNRLLHTLNAQQDHKLMFGLLFSLKSLTAKMDPTNAEKGNLGVPQLSGQGCSFHSFRTNTYKLSFMESPSGIKVVQWNFLDLGHALPSTSGIVDLAYGGITYMEMIFVSNEQAVLTQHRKECIFVDLGSDFILQFIVVVWTGDLRESLKYIYNLYVEYVVKNPLYAPGTPIRALLERNDLRVSGFDQLHACIFLKVRTSICGDFVCIATNLFR